MKKVLLFVSFLLMYTYVFSQPQVNLDTIIPATCNRSLDGAIYITVTGGVAPYSFAWSKPFCFDTEDIEGIPPGKYSMIVTDSLGQSSPEQSFIVEHGETIQIALDISERNGYQISWHGCGDGYIVVTGGTGNGNYQNWKYTWTDPNRFKKEGIVITALHAGIYHLVVDDSSGCTLEEDILLREPDPPIYSDTVTTYDTIPIYDTVYRFTEVKSELTFIDPSSQETLTILNYGDYLATDRMFNTAIIYDLTGSKVKQVNLENQIPVADLVSGIYLFVFEMDSGKIFRNKIYIE